MEYARKYWFMQGDSENHKPHSRNTEMSTLLHSKSPPPNTHTHIHTRKFPYERLGSCLLTYQPSISWNVVNGINEVGFLSFHVHRLYVHQLVSKLWGLCKVSEGTVVHIKERRMLVLVELSFWVDEVAEVIESSSTCWVGTDPSGNLGVILTR